ncbi:hypothetical protein niasHS_008668 [Heterodera schachtii]|uniref:Uncharacterized protein n=1 Tax=Heterodera schachtii TaxID=97005 RepID=A0ABD2JAP3_HETSC
MFGEKSFEKRPELVNEYAFNDVIDEAKMIDRIKLDNESFDKHFKALHDEFDKKLEQFAKNAIEMVANDEEMAEKEEIVKNIWQGHPFLIEEKLAKNGKRIANDNKEKMTVKKPKEENSKKGID